VPPAAVAVAAAEESMAWNSSHIGNFDLNFSFDDSDDEFHASVNLSKVNECISVF